MLLMKRPSVAFLSGLGGGTETSLDAAEAGVTVETAAALDLSPSALSSFATPLVVGAADDESAAAGD